MSETVKQLFKLTAANGHITYVVADTLSEALQSGNNKIEEMYVAAKEAAETMSFDKEEENSRFPIRSQFSFTKKGYLENLEKAKLELSIVHAENLTSAENTTFIPETL